MEILKAEVFWFAKKKKIIPKEAEHLGDTKQQVEE